VPAAKINRQALQSLIFLKMEKGNRKRLLIDGRISCSSIG
jgi:hypothetical protein